MSGVFLTGFFLDLIGGIRRNKPLINDRTHLTKLYVKTAHSFIYVTGKAPYDLDTHVDETFQNLGAKK